MDLFIQWFKVKNGFVGGGLAIHQVRIARPAQEQHRPAMGKTDAGQPLMLDACPAANRQVRSRYPESQDFVAIADF